MLNGVSRGKRGRNSTRDRKLGIYVLQVERCVCGARCILIRHGVKQSVSFEEANHVERDGSYAFDHHDLDVVLVHIKSTDIVCIEPNATVGFTADHCPVLSYFSLFFWCSFGRETSRGRVSFLQV